MEYIMNRLNVYKTHPNIILPKFGTKQAACFDLSFQAAGKYEYTGYNQYNAPFTRPISNMSIRIMPGDRIMIPTGLIFDIPEGYSVRIHPRSGLSYKQGLVLANLEAVIDSDYVQETYILLHNTSQVDQTIKDGDRIAQAEMIKKEEYVLWETTQMPMQKTDRIGGLGSTGIATITYNTNGMVGLAIIPEAPVSLTEATLPIKRGRGRPKKVVPST